MNTTFHIGDRVMFSREFLRGSGCIVGEIPHLRGDVINVQPLPARDHDLVTVRWDGQDTDHAALNTNLVLVSELHKESR